MTNPHAGADQREPSSEERPGTLERPTGTDLAVKNGQAARAASTPTHLAAKSGQAGSSGREAGLRRQPTSANLAAKSGQATHEQQRGKPTSSSSGQAANPRASRQASGGSRHARAKQRRAARQYTSSHEPSRQAAKAARRLTQAAGKRAGQLKPKPPAQRGHPISGRHGWRGTSGSSSSSDSVGSLRSKHGGSRRRLRTPSLLFTLSHGESGQRGGEGSGRPRHGRGAACPTVLALLLCLLAFGQRDGRRR